MKFIRSILLGAAVLATTLATAQEIAISNTTLEGCGGFLVDTGLSSSDYSNNEDITMTLCAEEPETIINLHFNLFNLGAGDQMTIYDGPDDTSPVLGTWVEDELIGGDVTSTNADGCLTINFTSDASDVGSFTAEISCGLPCLQPVVQVTVDQAEPIKICPGEELTFDASSTVFSEGTAIGTFEWNFGDMETDTENWPTVSHQYNVPGTYLVALDVTDDNDCESTNVIDIVVQVATEPTLELPEDFDMCPGEDINLEALLEGTYWDGSLGGISGGELFIPDDQSTCFESEITFTGFPPGSTIDDVSDLDFFYINFEHSFMGDLTITFECPDGNTIAVHQQNGGGTYLGEPVDVDTDLSPGVGYDYWWSPDATLGTWEEESFSYSTLPSGTYNSVQSWDALLGCSLNGDWSIEICDSWGSDNGFIFDWSVQFAEEFYENDLSFTPTFGNGCDSTFWTAGGVGESLSADCNILTLEETVATGDHTYTFTAIDDFGCTYTDEVNVFVNDPPPSFTLEEELFCLNEDDYYITPSGSNPDQYNWTWMDGSDDPSILYTEPQIYSYTVSNICGTSSGEAFIEGIVCEVTIPNIFTPDNGDEFNEFFVIDGLEYFPGSKLWIYNRWGNEVFYSGDYKNDWDPNADDLSDGTYYYILEVNKPAETEMLSGYVMVVRE